MIIEPQYADGVALNCAHALLDRHIVEGRGSTIAVVSDTMSWSFDELHERASRIAHVFTRDYDIVPGNRILLRAPNSPMLAALWLATQKCGAIAVTTMPLLRSAELAKILEIAKPALAVCESAIADDIRATIDAGNHDCALLTFEGDSGELGARMTRHADVFDNCDTTSEDISLIGFTSGTTGRPKATVHFHRDVLAICESVAGHIVRPQPQDVFIGTAPLAFTFGLGGLLLFPLYGGSTAVLNPHYKVGEFLSAIERYRATVCFTVPTFYKRMCAEITDYDISSLRLCVSSGEALPLPLRKQWQEATGISLTEFLGSTEMLHAFIGTTGADTRPGFIGRAIPGYQVSVLDSDGKTASPGEIGALAVRGPTGCRYLDDPRQSEYVKHRWNVTGDICLMDADGYVQYHARADDMIISSGYNISGAEVENVLLEHPHVLECAVIGVPDIDRGQVVAAYVVAQQPPMNEGEFIKTLQGHARTRLAPYKYPRVIHLLNALPRNESGKLQRFKLRDATAIVE
jgi:2-aminobenzoate-CoA ligase